MQHPLFHAVFPSFSGCSGSFFKSIRWKLHLLRSSIRAASRRPRSRSAVKHTSARPRPSVRASPRFSRFPEHPGRSVPPDPGWSLPDRIPLRFPSGQRDNGCRTEVRIHMMFPELVRIFVDGRLQFRRAEFLSFDQRHELGTPLSEYLDFRADPLDFPFVGPGGYGEIVAKKPTRLFFVTPGTIRRLWPCRSRQRNGSP